MFCSNCGNQIPEGHLFCMKCGAKAPGAPTGGPMSSGPAPGGGHGTNIPGGAPPVRPPKKKKTGLIIAIVLVVLLLILGAIGFGVYSYLSHKENDVSSYDDDDDKASKDRDSKDAEAVADDDDSDTDKDKDEDKHDDKSAELRYDGIYVRIYDWKEDGLLDTRAIRFYPDGYLIQASLAQTSKSDYLMPNAETFTRETYTTITGWYEIDGTDITFTTDNAAGTVDYWGIVSSDRMILDSLSNINGNQTTGAEYVFYPDGTWEKDFTY